MACKPLRVVSGDDSREEPFGLSLEVEGHALRTERLEAMARFERLWREAPESFDPTLKSIGRQRVARTWELLKQSSFSGEKRQACDLGCGSGIFAQKLCKDGWYVDAVDISSLALEKLQQQRISHLSLHREYIPYTKREDGIYDLVLCTDLIAELPPKLHRLLFAEIARLVKPKGYVLCSTPLSTYSENALENFMLLAESELDIQRWRPSYHRLWIWWSDLLAAPRRLERAGRHLEYRKKALSERSGLARYRFQLLSHSWLVSFWWMICWISEPIYRGFVSNDQLLRGMEKVSRFFWQENGITHIILLGQLRPLILPEETKASTPIQEARKKRSSWE